MGDRLDLYNLGDLDSNSGIRSARHRSVHHSMMFERETSSKDNFEGCEDYYLDLIQVVHGSPYDVPNSHSVSHTSALQHDFDYEDNISSHRKALSLVQPSEGTSYNERVIGSCPSSSQGPEVINLSSEPPLYSEVDTTSAYYSPQLPYSNDASNHLRMYSSPVMGSEPIHSESYSTHSYQLQPLSSTSFQSSDSASLHGIFLFLLFISRRSLCFTAKRRKRKTFC